MQIIRNACWHFKNYSATSSQWKWTTLNCKTRRMKRKNLGSCVNTNIFYLASHNEEAHLLEKIGIGDELQDYTTKQITTQAHV